jgi:hypothetical protein
MPKDHEKAIREIPREPEVIELFKKFVDSRSVFAAMTVRRRNDAQSYLAKSIETDSNIGLDNCSRLE